MIRITMLRFFWPAAASILLASSTCALQVRADDSNAQDYRFIETGPDVQLSVVRGGRPLAASLVPYVLAGDSIFVRLPFAAPLRTITRYHALIANVHRTDTPQDLRSISLFQNNAADGFSFRTRVRHAPVLLVFPEAGGQGDRGVSAVRDRLMKSSDTFNIPGQQILAVTEQHNRFSAFVEDMRKNIASTSLDTPVARYKAIAESLGLPSDKSFDECYSKRGNGGSEFRCFEQLALKPTLRVDPESLVGHVTGSYVNAHFGRISSYFGAILDLYLYIANTRKGVPAEYSTVPVRLTTEADGAYSGVALDSAWDPVAQPAPLMVIALPEVVNARPVAPKFVAPNAPVCASESGFTFALPATGADQEYLRAPRVKIADRGVTLDTIPILYDTKAAHMPLPSSINDSGSVSFDAVVEADWGFDTATSDNFTLLVPRSVRSWTAVTSLISGQHYTHFALRGPEIPCLTRVSLSVDQRAGVQLPEPMISGDAAYLDVDLTTVQPGQGKLVLHFSNGIDNTVPVTVNPSPTPTPSPSPMPSPTPMPTPSSTPAFTS